jgi:hypothetical protein
LAEIDPIDGLPIGEVGAWANEKHELLRRYVDATRGVRRQFTIAPRRSGITPQGATFIDLFSGPGRARVRETGALIDGSAIAVATMAAKGGAPFSAIFVGMFDDAFWAVVGKQRIDGRTAAEVLGPLVTKAGESDLSWMSEARLLDALCRLELAFVIRRNDRVQWVLSPFRDPPDTSGDAETIGEAISALIQSARIRYGAIWARTGVSLS